MRKDKLLSILTVVKCLEQAEGPLSMREIARRTKLHHETVRRVVKTISPLLDVKDISLMLGDEVSLPNLPHFISLREDINVEKAFRWLKFREKFSDLF